MRKNIIVIALGFMSLASCVKDRLSRPLGEFNVTTANTTVDANTDVLFELTGNPNMITFYSGEPGSIYENRARTVQKSGQVQLSFKTSTTASSSGDLSLLISTDLATIDSLSIAKATWTNISSRATWATGTATVASGIVDLTSEAQQGKPIYIAFKYAADANQTQRKWSITDFKLEHILSDITYTIGDMTNTTPSLGWQTVVMSNPAVKWNLIKDFSITGSTSVAKSVNTESWLVMGPVDLNRVLPDAGQAIKHIAENMSKFPFKYSYAKPGTYKATFVAANETAEKREEIVKTIVITVK